MAKSFSLRLLRNNLGQSAVEYILLLAVISSLGYTFYNNAKFKSFIAGKDGLFATMKKGISYSYRYGLEYNTGVSLDVYEYDTNKHDTYYNAKDNTSHFFQGAEPYPQ